MAYILIFPATEMWRVFLYRNKWIFTPPKRGCEIFLNFLLDKPDIYSILERSRVENSFHKNEGVSYACYG